MSESQDHSSGGEPCARRRFLFLTASLAVALAMPLHAQLADISQEDADFLRTAIENIAAHSLKNFTQPEIIAGAHAELRKALGQKYRTHFADGIPPDADLDLAANIYIESVRNVANAAPPNAQDFAIRVLIERSLNMFLATIDEYSEFIPGSVAPDLLKLERAVEYTGIGVDLTHSENGLVCNPHPSENAAFAGVRKGDLLVRIDNVETRTMTTYEAALRLRGAAGSTARITVRHDGPNGEDEHLAVEREKTQRAPLEIRPDRGFGLNIRVSEITPATAESLQRELLALGPDKAVLLDFRGNPGGGFDDAVRVAQLFLPKGTTIATLDRRKGKLKSFSENTTPYTPSKLTILQDEFTGSAAEMIIVALTAYAPLQTRTLGKRTYGKGVVQDHIKLKDGDWGIVKITSYKMYGPNNEDWNEKGIPADGDIPDSLAH